MKLFNREIPPGVRHFYSASKWWHINQDWWERAFALFRARYFDEDIEITEEDEPPIDEDESLDDEDDGPNWTFGGEPFLNFDDEIDLNTGQPSRPVSFDSMSLAQALALLHLVPTADFEDAKVMYRHLSRQHHPDMGGTDGEQIALNRAFGFVESVLAKTLTWNA